MRYLTDFYIFIFLDMNDDLKTNNYYLLNKLLKNKYGKFNKISNISFIICFKNMYVFIISLVYLLKCQCNCTISFF